MQVSDSFRTTFQIEESKNKISYQSHTLWIGSCFTENLGLWLQEHGVQSVVNPFGILYNPFSIYTSLKRIISGNKYDDSELEFFNGKYISFDHHGRFSGNDREIVLSGINKSLLEAESKIKKADWLFITFGTAAAFKKTSSGKLVANCHKIPGTEFDRILLPPEQMLSQWNNLIKEIQRINSNIQIVFTLSPVRHWRDGATENQRSKSMLNSLIHNIIDNNDNCAYFPAYEIMMDDLRDYRFYAKDMIHPSDVAVEYIRKRFLEIYFETKDLETLKKVQKLVKASLHRTEDSNPEEAKTFLSNQLATLSEFKELRNPPNLSHLEILFNYKLSKLL
jgi:lysophospholipase L1-like esterase